jgi:hypothetical protein
MLNANRNDWDVMLYTTTMWAYQIANKVTTQATPFELVYGTQPVMLINFYHTYSQNLKYTRR